MSLDISLPQNVCMCMFLLEKKLNHQLENSLLREINVFFSVVTESVDISSALRGLFCLWASAVTLSHAQKRQLIYLLDLNEIKCLLLKILSFRVVPRGPHCNQVLRQPTVKDTVAKLLSSQCQWENYFSRSMNLLSGYNGYNILESYCWFMSKGFIRLEGVV